MNTKLIHSLEVQNTLGEGVIYDYRNDSLLWTDIEGYALYRYDCDSRKIDKMDTDERIGAFALTSDKQQLLCAFASGFALYHLHSGQKHWLHRPDELRPGNGLRLNDGRLDKMGRFWCGAMVEDKDKCPDNKAALYCLHPDGSIQKQLDNISISNGICWSPDQQYFYFADSPERLIYRFRYHPERAAISARQIFAQTPEHHFPDGAVTDSEGYVWSAHWGSAKVIRYTPQGKIDSEITLPVPQPSCVAFGGKSMSKLFITTARWDLSNQQLQQYPQSGNLFIYETSVAGTMEPLFDLSLLS